MKLGLNFLLLLQLLYSWTVCLSAEDASPTVAAVNSSRVQQFLAACSSGDLSAIEDEHRSGVDVNYRNSNRWTPLMFAVRGNQDKAVHLLIELRADVNAQENDGWTALMIASVLGQAQTVQRLVQADADLFLVNRDGKNAINLASEQKQGDVKTFLVYAGIKNALERKNLTRVLDMVRMGAPVNTKISSGLSPLMLACNDQAIDAVQFLLQVPDVDVNIKESGGWIPLMVAAYLRDLAMVTLLLNHGADTRLRSNTGLSSADVASQFGSSEIVELIAAAASSIPRADGDQSVEGPLAGSGVDDANPPRTLSSSDGIASEDKIASTDNEVASKNGDTEAEVTSENGDEVVEVTSKNGDVVVEVTSENGDEVIEVTSVNGDAVVEVTSENGDTVFEVTSVNGDTVVEVTSKNGDAVVEVTSENGDTVVEVTSVYGDEEVEVTSKNGDAVVEVISENGDTVVEVSSKIASKNGDEVIEVVSEVRVETVMDKARDAVSDAWMFTVKPIVQSIVDAMEASSLLQQLARLIIPRIVSMYSEFPIGLVLIAVFALLLVLSLCQSPNPSSSSSSSLLATRASLWLPREELNPSKFQFEYSVVTYARIWVSIFVLLSAAEASWEGEQLTAESLLGFSVALMLPCLIQSALFPLPAERRLAWHERYSVKAHLWMAIMSFVSNYWCSHYYSAALVTSSRDIPRYHLNGVPIFLYLCTHIYLLTIHCATNIVLRTIESRHLPGIPRTMLFWTAVLALSSCAAFLQLTLMKNNVLYSFEHMGRNYSLGKRYSGCCCCIVYCSSRAVCLSVL